MTQHNAILTACSLHWTRYLFSVRSELKFIYNLEEHEFSECYLGLIDF